ncbi:hypothetical protein GOODEAATRI_007387, partial [Goodea atripinnis]
PQEAVAFLLVDSAPCSGFAVNLQMTTMKFRLLFLVSVLLLSATADLQGKKQTPLFSDRHLWTR